MKRTTGNFTTQTDGQFPLDCETLAMLQENGNIQAIIGNFWVNVPSGLLNTAQEQRLRAVIDRYKLTTKRYEINYIN